MRARNWTNLKRIEQTNKGCRNYLKWKFVIKIRIKQSTWAILRKSFGGKLIGAN